ncbi:MAG: hypothetical protein ACFE95_07640 [Candidatus Hodarchaeota archaeon]
MNSRDIWASAYLGSRYSFNEDGIFYRVPRTHQDVYAVKWSKKILDKLFDIKPGGGSFRITDRKEIITKVKSDENSIPYYVCEYDGSILFEDVELDPGPELRTGDIWPGFYYLHGTRYSLSYYNEIFWRGDFGRKYYVISDNIDLIDRLRVFLPMGGRFYVTENNKVWTNSEHVMNWRRAQDQINNFSNKQKNLLEQRISSTMKYPVYVCDYEKSLTLDLEDYRSDRRYDDESDWTGDF